MSFLYLDEAKNVAITDDGLSHPEVKEFYLKDTTSDKKKFFKAMTYIYYCYFPGGIFSNKTPEDRKRIACNTYLEGMDPKVYEDNKFVQRVIAVYRDLCITPAEQLYERIKFDIQEVQKVLSEVPFFKEIKVKLETEVELDVKVEGETRTVKVPVNQTVVVQIDNSDAKAKAIQNTTMLFKQEKELRNIVEKERIEKRRLRRKFDEVQRH